MPDLWKKLNLKDQERILVLSAPDEFAAHLDTLDDVEVVQRLGAAKKIEFLLAFVTKQTEIARLAQSIGKRAEGDPVLWFAYPKKSSKRYSCDFSRDTGWEPLGAQGFEGVRQVAIDEDWSALRFRRVEHIKTMTRDKTRALSKQGRSRKA